MKKVTGKLKMLLKILSILVVVIIVYVVVALALAYVPVNTDTIACEENCVEVYLYSNGVHTDIVLPVVNNQQDWRRVIDPSKTKAGSTDFSYVSMGWGDKGFYLNTPTWGDLTAATAFKALFYLGESAMHVTFYKSMKESERCKKVFISAEQYKRIIEYVHASFKTDISGKYQHIPNVSYGNNDLFFEAKGSYSMFYTCNSWTNNCLKAGEMKACLWTLLDKGIFFHYK
ncbi:MAG: TIGR02117 family protein [Cytophaga sp.]|uniref:TIGR02117 family protein n=1 Tax=Cytophaga sp. TaxID=29535 RepID=UPI003F7E8A60